MTASLYTNIILKKTNQTINKNNQYIESAVIFFLPHGNLFPEV